MVAEERNRRIWMEAAIVFAAWLIFGLLVATQSFTLSALGGRQMPLYVALRPALVDSILWALTTLAIFWLARRFPIERGRILRGIAVHIVAAVVIALARTGVMLVLRWYVPWLRVQPSFSLQFWITFSQNVLFYALLLGIAHLVIYYRRYREREQVAEQLARGLTEARLQALKMQLQPHFLFNTLNAISALIPADAKPARRMVARLGDLLRSTLGALPRNRAGAPRRPAHGRDEHRTRNTGCSGPPSAAAAVGGERRPAWHRLAYRTRPGGDLGVTRNGRSLPATGNSGRWERTPTPSRAGIPRG
jgi:hypothetical protein